MAVPLVVRGAKAVVLAMAVADGLAANKGLRVLSLASNNLRTSGAMRVAENVGYNTAAGDGAGLTALDLGWCGIDDSSAHKLAQGLHEAAESAKGCSLRRLDLSHNKLGKDGAGELARARLVLLCRCTSMRAQPFRS